jgi:hypothetical protein
MEYSITVRIRRRVVSRAQVSRWSWVTWFGVCGASAPFQAAASGIQSGVGGDWLTRQCYSSTVPHRLPHRGNYCPCARGFTGMGPNCQRPRNQSHSMRQIRGRCRESARHNDKKRDTRDRFGLLCHSLLPPLPPPPPLHQSLEPRSERKKRKKSERTFPFFVPFPPYSLG